MGKQGAYLRNISTKHYIMKILLTILLFLLTLNVGAQDSFALKPDKAMHFGVGTAFGATYTGLVLNRGTYNDFDAIVGPQFVMMFIGMGKEAIDFKLRTGHFSWHDIAYNQMGCLTGSLISYGIHKAVEYRNRKREKLKL